jgi:transposase
VIAAQDEATFGLLPNIVRGWARKGSRPRMVQHPQHKKINVFGARSKRGFAYFFSKHKNQRIFVRQMEQLHKRWGKVCLFADNAKWHGGEYVDKFLAAHRRTFRLFRFLKYAPELNPVEQCWKPARKRTGNRLLHTLPALQYHLKMVFGKPSLLPKMFHYLAN